MQQKFADEVLVGMDFKSVPRMNQWRPNIEQSLFRDHTQRQSCRLAEAGSASFWLHKIEQRNRGFAFVPVQHRHPHMKTFGLFRSGSRTSEAAYEVTSSGIRNRFQDSLIAFCQQLRRKLKRWTYRPGASALAPASSSACLSLLFMGRR